MNQSEKMDKTSFNIETFERGDKIVMAAKCEGRFIEHDIEVHFSKNIKLVTIHYQLAYDHGLSRRDTLFYERGRIPCKFDRKTPKHEIKDGIIIKITANKTKRVFGNKSFKFTDLSDNDLYMSEISIHCIEFQFSEDDDVERRKADEAIEKMSQENNDSSEDEEKAEKDDEDICSTGEQSSNKVIVKVTITDKRPGYNNDSVIKEFNFKEKHMRMEKIQEEKLKNGAKRKHGNKTCVTGKASNEEIEKVADENCQQMLQERIIEVTNNEESKEEEKEEIEGVGHHEREEGTNSDSDGSFVKLLDEEHEEQTDEEVGTLEKTEAEEREEGTNSDSDGSFVKLLPEEREEKVSDSDDSWEKHLEVESGEESHTASSEEWEVVDEEKRN